MYMKYALYTTLHYTTLHTTLNYNYNYNFNKLNICGHSYRNNLLIIHKRDKTTRKLLIDYFFVVCFDTVFPFDTKAKTLRTF